MITLMVYMRMSCENIHVYFGAGSCAEKYSKGSKFRRRQPLWTLGDTYTVLSDNFKKGNKEKIEHI